MSKALSKTALIKSNRELKDLLEMVLVSARKGNLDHIFSLVKSDFTVSKNTEGKWNCIEKSSQLNISELDEIIKERRSEIIDGLDLAIQRLGDYNRVIQGQEAQKEFTARKETPEEKIEKIENKIQDEKKFTQKGNIVSIQRCMQAEIEQRAEIEERKREQKKIDDEKKKDDLGLFYSLSYASNRPQDVIFRLKTKKNNPIWQAEYESFKALYPNHPAWGLEIAV